LPQDLTYLFLVAQFSFFLFCDLHRGSTARSASAHSHKSKSSRTLPLLLTQSVNDDASTIASLRSQYHVSTTEARLEIDESQQCEQSAYEYSETDNGLLYAEKMENESSLS
jgi:hypothetical protein